MGIREAIERNKAWVAPALILLVVVAVVVSALRDRQPAVYNADVISKAYYSDDEGNTYFVDDVEKPFPFERAGKQAYRAYVYRCDESGKPFVGLLGRLVKHDVSASGPSTQPSAEATATRPAAPGVEQFRSIEVKKPGTSDWVPFGSPEGRQLIVSVCPTGRPEAVLPSTNE